MALTDFTSGLQSASDYLDTRHHLSGTTALGSDALRVVANAEYSFSLREILCGVLGGNGLKMPNLQICMSSNINALLNIPGIQSELFDALSNLDSSMNNFMEHTKLDSVLGRLNGILAEAQQVANLINFCSAPVDPIAIPNMLERAFGSFLGAGKSIIDDIGSIAPENVCACLSLDGGFNANVFNGGVLGRIANNINDITSGNLLQSELDAITNDISSIGDAVSGLLAFENNISGSYSSGGSQFATPDGSCNSEVGVLHNPTSGNIADNARLTSSLKSLYDRMAGYPVQYSLGASTGGSGTGHQFDSNGKRILSGDVVEYPNIFHLLLDPEMIALLDTLDDPQPEINNQVPVYDYCGNIIGYTSNLSQRDLDEKSQGTNPSVPNSPGYLAGGLPTSTSGTTSTGGDVTVINNFTSGGATLYIVSSEAGQLSLSVNTNDLVVRSDQLATYVRLDTATFNTGTMADYQPSTPILNPFVADLNTTNNSGIIIKDGNTSRARALEGQAGQISIANPTGQGGNIKVEIAENARMPGTEAIKIPTGSTSQRPNTEIGEIRYNTDSDRIEGYFGDTNSWKSIALLPDIVTASVNNANIGSGTGIFKQTAGTVQQFKSLTPDGAITIADGDQITIGDSITASNQGSGAGIFKQRNGNDLQFKSLTSTDNSVVITNNADTIDVSGDPNVLKATLTTTSNNVTEVLFNSASLNIPTGKTWLFNALVLAKNGTENQGWKLEGMVQDNSGSASLIGSVSKVYYQRNTADAQPQEVWDPMKSYNASDLVEYDLNVYQANTAITPGGLSPDQAGSNWQVTYTGWNASADINSSAFKIRVKGEISTTVNWSIRLTYVEA